MSDPATDRATLREAAYDADDDLRVRREVHVQYSEQRGDFHEWVLSHLPRHPHDALLDVGTGPGDFPRLLRARGHTGLLIGCDLSEGMMQTAQAAAPALTWLVADAQALPFADASFHGVMARHMLYHVPDIPRAVAELARVTKPGGWLAAVTNSATSMEAIFTLWNEIEHTLAPKQENINRRFSLEKGGEFLAPHFGLVVTHVREDALLLPSVEPLQAYLASGRHLLMAPTHTEADWQVVRAQLFEGAERLWQREARDGLLRLPKSSGLILATHPTQLAD